MDKQANINKLDDRLKPPNSSYLLNLFSIKTDLHKEIQVEQKKIQSILDFFSHNTIPLEEIPYLPPSSITTNQSWSSDRVSGIQQAIDYYKSNNIRWMVVQEHGIGTRGILILFKDKLTAKKIVGRITLGNIYTESASPYFSSTLTEDLLSTLHRNFVQHNYFEKNNTDYIILEVNIKPWSINKDITLLDYYSEIIEKEVWNQEKLIHDLYSITKNNRNVLEWLKESENKLVQLNQIKKSILDNSWEVNKIEDIKIEILNVLAHSHYTFINKSNLWQLSKIEEIINISPLFTKNNHIIIDNKLYAKKINRLINHNFMGTLNNLEVKPFQFIPYNQHGYLIYPSIKVWHPFDYLEELSNKNNKNKRQCVLKEFSLGIESLNRFVRQEPVQRIHECVIGILSIKDIF